MVTIVHVHVVSLVINVKLIIDLVNRILVGTTVSTIFFILYVTSSLVEVYICNETSDTTFQCICQNGWIGDNCESTVNYCDDSTCMNNAVCRPLFLNYSCECLTSSYSGRHCEMFSTGLIVLQTVCKSFGYIVIIMLIAAASFVVILDILKYGFGIDPNKEDLARMRQSKRAKRTRCAPVIKRFVYINKSFEESSIGNDRKNNSTIEARNV